MPDMCWRAALAVFIQPQIKPHPDMDEASDSDSDDDRDGNIEPLAIRMARLDLRTPAVFGLSLSAGNQLTRHVRQLAGPASSISLEPGAFPLPEDPVGVQLELYELRSRSRQQAVSSVELVFPEKDLLDALVELYFHHMNSHFPFLHGPMFTQAVKAGKHLVEGGFGATVMLVCAIGSRFTRDPRVLLAESNYHPYSAGWKWFQAVERARRLSFAPAGLHDLQVYAVRDLQFLRCEPPMTRPSSSLWRCSCTGRTRLRGYGQWSARASGRPSKSGCTVSGCTLRRRTSRRSSGGGRSGEYWCHGLCQTRL